jgi:serine/threonine protein kinase
MACAAPLDSSSAPGAAPVPTPAVPAQNPTIPARQPDSFADGRYQVKRFLGEGGKKKVYLAHDTTLDRDVAFALIKTEGLDDTSRQRIQREAQAIGRLGSHSHIVTVFDLGEERNQPYMVTELMGGGDVEGLIEDAEGHRLLLEQAVNIAQETCRGLEFAHSRGIVHRDMKPGNVWLTTDGVAKIGDFGLAVSLDRSRLTTEGIMVWTDTLI